MQSFFDDFQRCHNHLNIKNGHKHADAQGDIADPARKKFGDDGSVQNRLSLLLYIGLVTLFLPLQVQPSFAMNWEGHDEWPDMPVIVDKLKKGIAPPIKAQLPSCAERRAKHAVNPYEQTAIVGENCIEKPAP
jgi:hypothetical protein